MIETLRKENAEIKEEIRQRDCNREKEAAELREELRQRDCNREKEMHLFMEKISDLTLALVD